MRVKGLEHVQHELEQDFKFCFYFITFTSFSLSFRHCLLQDKAMIKQHPESLSYYNNKLHLIRDVLDKSMSFVCLVLVRSGVWAAVWSRRTR